MGNNLDLCRMLGIPSSAVCPKCNATEKQDFEDYDIECGDPNPSPGEWKLKAHCRICDHSWEICFKLTRAWSKSVSDGKETWIEKPALGGVSKDGSVVWSYRRTR